MFVCRSVDEADLQVCIFINVVKTQILFIQDLTCISMSINEEEVIFQKKATKSQSSQKY